MRETVCIHVGQCGNQIGNQFWNLMLHEHEKTPDDDPALSAFFRFDSPRNSNEKVMKARALLIDMECGPLQETMKSNLGSLFDQSQLIHDVSGAGNNFAHGHYVYGPQYRDRFEEGLRRNVEQCESLQTYLVTQSLGGGTGSGVGTYILSMLSDLYPKIYRFSACVYPSGTSDVITAPYNTILATNELIEHADCVFPLDNSALFNFAKAEKTIQLANSSKNKYNEIDPVAADQVAKKAAKDKGYNDINLVAARMLCHLTSSARFHGEMNVDLNEIYTNLIPFPKLHFLMTALSLREKPVNAVSAGVNMMMRGRPANNDSTRLILQRAFSDILGTRGQITAANPTERGRVTLASAFLARGKVPLSDFLNCVTDATTKLSFPAWNPDACKTGMCSTASPGDESSVLAVYNSTAFGAVLSREQEAFHSMFKVRANIHHYVDMGISIDQVREAEQNCIGVISDYSELECGTYAYRNNSSIDRRESGGRNSGSAAGDVRTRTGDGYAVAGGGGDWSDPDMHDLFPAF